MGIVVDYTVDLPPDTVVALSSADLTAALSTSPMMVDVAAAVGATGLTATSDAVISTDPGAPAPGSNTPSSDASQTIVIVSGIGAAMAALAISAVVILGVLYLRRTQHAAVATPPSKSRTVVIVQQAAPETSVVNPMAATAVAERTAFEPTQRSRV
jgi:hypothetical protein